MHKNWKQVHVQCTSERYQINVPHENIMIRLYLRRTIYSINVGNNQWSNQKRVGNTHIRHGSQKRCGGSTLMRREPHSGDKWWTRCENWTSQADENMTCVHHPHRG